MLPVMWPCTVALLHATLTISFHPTQTVMVAASQRVSLALQVEIHPRTPLAPCEHAAAHRTFITALTRHAEAGTRSWNSLDLFTK